MGAGAAGVICLILMRLAARHGWAWVQGQVKQHAGAVEADFKQKVSAAVGDLDARIRVPLGFLMADSLDVEKRRRRRAKRSTELAIRRRPEEFSGRVQATASCFGLAKA
jgi:hypothetical protein